MEDMRAAARSFETIGTFGSGSPVWDEGGRSEPAPTLRATPNLMEALRLRPVLGRTLVASDASAGAELVALISFELWQTHYRGSTEVLGQTVTLDRKSYSIVGVLPVGLRFPISRALGLGSGTILQEGHH